VVVAAAVVVAAVVVVVVVAVAKSLKRSSSGCGTGQLEARRWIVTSGPFLIDDLTLQALPIGCPIVGSGPDGRRDAACVSGSPPPACRSRSMLMQGNAPMSRFTRAARSFAADETGATNAEYVLLCVLIGLVCVGVVTVIGTSVHRFFDGVPPVG
jgi:Flp pilus assembly pilin Flp